MLTFNKSGDLRGKWNRSNVVDYRYRDKKMDFKYWTP